MSELNKDTDNTNQYNSEFSYDENKSNLKISFERITFIFFVFFIIAIIFSSKVILLSLQTKPEIRKISKKENFRASILDKEGNILAKSGPIVNVGINPNLVINKKKLLISLKILFPEKLRKFNKAKIVYCPPYTLLYGFVQKLKKTKIEVGAQNCHFIDGEGPYTGFVSSKND